jgi:Na+-transporting NADH:ubiquinone oxidoreductase subunit A
MSKIIKIKKGLDINLQGKAEAKVTALPMAASYAVSPLDFEGVVPKLLVKAGEQVKAGDALFFSKNDSRVLFTSPVSGTVTAVNRGEKRKVLNVTVQPDATQSFKEFTVPAIEKASKDDVTKLLLEAGLWPLIIQRPYGIIANPDDQPKAIFVSGFDSAPLAADNDVVLANDKANLQKGFDVLARLTSGKVHLSLNAKAENKVFEGLKGVEVHEFAGPHPAGNVGVQIHHIDPINKGEVVWTVSAEGVAMIGRLFATGKVDMTKTIVLCGSQAEAPQYYTIIAGAAMDSILAGRVKAQKEGDSVRVISGNVLTGTKVAADGYLTFYSNQVTLIPEGDKYELLGWAMPRFNKFSVSTAYFSWLCPKKQYDLDTNLNGGERPFVVSGLYDKYLPMDIYPVYLLKAILAGDIDKMENLGIYEIVEEDLALCEFVDPSKIEMQDIVRQGINQMIKEMN